MGEEVIAEEAATTAETGSAGHTDSGGPGLIAWEYDVPLITNRFMLYEFAKVSVLSVLLMYAFIGLMGVVIDGELVIIPWFVGAVAGGSLFVLMFVAALLMGNRSRATFIIGPKGVGYEAGAREKALTRTAAAGGALGGSATGAGAGAIAVARDSEYLAWDDIHRVSLYPAQRVISLKNSWRVLLRLYVPPELWAEASSAVESRNAEVAATRGATSPTSPAFRIAWAVAALLLTMGAHAWPWAESMLTVRAGVLGGLLVMASGLTEGPLRRITGLAGAAAVFAHAVGLFFSEFDAPSELLGIEYAYDGGLLAVALACTVVLILMGVWRGVGGARRGDSQ